MSGILNKLKMITKVFQISPTNPDPEIIEQAAEIIKNNGLVAFPTETVYGLGANALSVKAVEKIFLAKNRPSDNPIIVHIADKKEMENIAQNIPKFAWTLADKFWPGPLTFILQKKNNIPLIVSGNSNTVAVRMPSHPVALFLIKKSGVPIAAPSANTSTRPSSTKASHVYDDLNGKIDCILDAGEVSIGIESTVIDLTLENPVILRPGAITREMLSEFIPNFSNIPNSPNASSNPNSQTRSPGTKYKHYAPDCEVILLIGQQEFTLGKITNMYKELTAQGKKCWIVCQKELDNLPRSDQQILLTSKDYANNIFSIFREAEKQGISVILVQGLEEIGMGHAVMNRLKKSATGII